MKHPDRAEADRFFNYPYAAIEEALSNAVYHRATSLIYTILIRNSQRIIMLLLLFQKSFVYKKSWYKITVDSESVRYISWTGPGWGGRACICSDGSFLPLWKFTLPIAPSAKRLSMMPLDGIYLVQIASARRTPFLPASSMTSEASFAFIINAFSHRTFFPLDLGVYPVNFALMAFGEDYESVSADAVMADRIHHKRLLAQDIFPVFQAQLHIFIMAGMNRRYIYKLYL